MILVTLNLKLLHVHMYQCVSLSAICSALAYALVVSFVSGCSHAMTQVQTLIAFKRCYNLTNGTLSLEFHIYVQIQCEYYKSSSATIW